MNSEEPFIDKMIRWMKHDVKVCMDNDAYVGAMKLMMNDISALAGFYAGRNTPKPSPPITDEIEFMNFFDNYFKVLNALPHSIILKPVQGMKVINLIYTHFRCGLIHEHLMKNGTAIDKRGDNEYLYLTQGGITININCLYNDYLKTLEEYYSDVKNKNKLNVQENFIKRAEYLGAYQPYI